MDNLEYEFSGQQPSKDRGQSFVVEVKKKETKSQDKAVQFSVDVIKALEEKTKAHNESSLKKVTLHQLKTVFCNAIKEYHQNNEITNTIWAFARVNVYLRIAAGAQPEFVNIVNTRKKPNLIEISAEWSPSQLDVENAEKLVEEKSLDFSFTTLDDLYINFQPLHWQID